MVAVTSVIIALLYKWQTLFSGLIALGAAFIGWRAVRKQISHADLQFATTRQQRFIISADQAFRSNWAREANQGADRNVA